jgi:hypothetical protein
MDGNISKALWLGVSILLFVAVVTIGLTVFNNMKDGSEQASKKISSISDSLGEQEYRTYDGKEVKGDDVISAISMFGGRSGDVIVCVRTLGAGAQETLDPSSGSAPAIGGFDQYVSNTTAGISVKDKCFSLTAGSGDLLKTVSKNLQAASRRDAEDSNLTAKYVNPAGRFMSQLLYDSNQKIRGVIFAQIE